MKRPEDVGWLTLQSRSKGEGSKIDKVYICGLVDIAENTSKVCGHVIRSDEGKRHYEMKGPEDVGWLTLQNKSKGEGSKIEKVYI
jgi:hypothetical protein